MEFLDKAKTILFGDQNNRGAHGFWAGFVPTIVPSLVAAGAMVLGAPVAVVAGGVGTAGVVGATNAVAAGATAGALAAATGAVGAVVAVTAGDVTAGDAGAVAGAAVVTGGLAILAAVKAEEKEGYNFKKHRTGGLTGCVLAAALVFNVAADRLPQEQPKAPVPKTAPSGHLAKIPAQALALSLSR